MRARSELIDLASGSRSVALRTLDGNRIRIVAEGHQRYTVLGRYRTGLLLGVDEPFPRVLITTMVRHAGYPPAHDNVALDSILFIP